jgi:hypothetical protein
MNMKRLFFLLVINLFLICNVDAGSVLPIWIGGQDEVLSSLYIEYNEQEYNITVDDFKNRSDLDSFDIFFISYISASLDGNSQFAMGLIEGEDNEQAELIANRNVRGLKMLKEKSDCNCLTLKSKIYLGDDIVYLVKGKLLYRKSEFKDYHALFRVVKDDSGTLMLGQETNITRLLLGVYNKFPENVMKTESQKSRSYKYQVTLYGEGTKNPVFMKFNGQYYGDFDVFDDKKTTPNPVLSYYKRTNLDRANFDKSLYSTHLTTTAKAKFDKYASTNERYQSYSDQVLKEGRVVTFVMDIDPVYVVFYKQKQADGKNPFLHYDFVLKEGMGDYKLTRFALSDSFDDLLTNVDVQRVMKAVVVPESPQE